MRQLRIDLNEFGFVALLTNSIRQSNLGLGCQVRTLALRSYHCSYVYTANAVNGMYNSCGRFDDAPTVFDKRPQRDVSSWNAFISAMVKDYRYGKAFELFREMKMVGNFWDRITTSTIQTTASEGFFVEDGEAIHGYALKLGWDSNLSVGNALVRFYTKFGGVEDVIGLFEKRPNKDVISWTEMLNGFMEFGFAESAVKAFNEMLERNTVSCNSLLAGFCKNGDMFRALKMFLQILNHDVEISVFTLTSVVNACAIFGDRKQRKQIHRFVIKMGFESNAWIEAGLLDMCTKCNRMEDAEAIYDRKI